MKNPTLFTAVALTKTVYKVFKPDSYRPDNYRDGNVYTTGFFNGTVDFDPAHEPQKANFIFKSK